MNLADTSFLAENCKHTNVGVIYLSFPSFNFAVKKTKFMLNCVDTQSPKSSLNSAITDTKPLF